ncbi:MAG: COX15/CtaA family protein, partial [Candidatus Omnitrophica bacterium]|nr:COX15/CtaA family protein [Candidatus Omnitrophota bacterium]
MSLFAWATAAITWLLLIAGGLVTSTDSGLAVPDWPLSYGTLLPPMVGGIRYEHTHRLIAGLVALMIAILAAWLWRRERRRWVRRLGAAAAVVVLTQAILGGLTVLLVLPAPISIAHACLGPLVFCVTVVLAQAMSPGWASRRMPLDGGRAGMTAVWTTAAFIAQLVLGAVLRHTGGALTLHLIGAAAVLLMTGRLLQRTRRDPAIFRGTLALALGVVGQLLLGVLAWRWREQVLVTTAHQALGALLVAGSTALTARLMSQDVRARLGQWRRHAADYLALTKPRLTFLALLAVLAG